MDDALLSALLASGDIRTVPNDVVRAAQAHFLDKVRREFLTSALVHPLGFFYLAVNVSASRSIRYHVWLDRASISEDQKAGEIHDHRYELNSLVLAGSLLHETFASSQKEGGGFSVFEIEYHESSSRAGTHRGDVDLTELSRNEHSTGEAYRLPPRTIHRAQPLTLPAATLVLTVLPKNAPSPKVFVPKGRSMPPSFDRVSVNEDQVSLCVAALENVLSP